MKLLKIGAVAGALALAGSLGLGVSAAHAVVDPVVTVTNANAEGVVPNGYVEASITGCSVADGAVKTVHAQGVKTNQAGTAEPVTVQVLLYNQYERVTPPAPEAPPAAPPASGPKPGDKPTALPRTGSEGMGLVPAAALISVVAGGLAVALRSRKH